MSNKPIDLAAQKARQGTFVYRTWREPPEQVSALHRAFYEGLEPIPAWALGTAQAVCLNPEDEQRFTAAGIAWKAVWVHYEQN